MIRTIFFDFDGVLTTDQSGSQSTLRSLSAQTGLSEQMLWSAFEPYNHDLILGRTTHVRIWPDLCTRLGMAIPFAMLTHAFAQTPINQPVLALARELHQRHAIGMITDNKADRMEVIIQQHRLADSFNPIVISADVGSDKRGPAIFQHALALAETDAENALFVDNTPRNLIAAAALGMHTLLFDGTTASAHELRRTLRPILCQD